MRRPAALVACVLTLTLAASARTSEGPRFALGRTGGSIAPFRVEIEQDGTLERTGPVRLARPDARLSRARLEGLVRFARAHGFWSVSRVILCPSSLPDYASFFVTIRTEDGARTVRVRGSCSGVFSRVYAAVASAAGVVR